MKRFFLLLFGMILTTSAYAQLRSGEFYQPPASHIDSTTHLTFVPVNYGQFLQEINIDDIKDQQVNSNKTFRRAGWLMKNIFLHSKFDEFGFYPPVESMADFTTRSASEYNALAERYSIYFDR
ncbi:hypothetical protein [Gracilimonas mengyeensis]|uniref:YARHG domain-containing protein n=1 Tax=Gracilimonas mengyeensis TaxID=1302730 RepID=A0A521E3R5_9BACT|nr:hypothetical protein [Gracilimonas mengyeensis]SMO78577.1 hypothetical protein SAMN06265219_110126 [Gracilimonas mengyeensis]